MTIDPERAAIRLGYGLSPRVPPADTGFLLDSVAQATQPDGWTATAATAAHLAFGEVRKARDEGALSAEEYRAEVQVLEGQRLDAFRNRLARAAGAPAGFGERLVQFWADHFTVVAQNPTQHLMAAAFVDEAIRPHLDGRFGAMLFAAATHPMMLIYLNQNASVGPNSRFARRRPELHVGLNENLGREVLELHTLGVGADYTQADVRELAKVLTGLTYNPRDHRRFRPQVVEPGAETVLGVSYGDGLPEIARALDDLAVHPATARHLARKLATHFAADDPPEALVADLAAVWTDTGGDLRAVSAALVTHPDLAATFRQKARQPFDFVAAALRALGLGAGEILALDRPQVRQYLLVPMQRMGQPFGKARGPDGWPEPAGDWITPQLLSARIGWALSMPQRLVEAFPDPRAFLSTALGTTASEALVRAVPRAENAREGVAIVLASTEFNRR